MSILVTKNSRITANYDESGRAYMAAESGIERGISEVNDKIKGNIAWDCSGIIPITSGDIDPDANMELRYNITFPKCTYTASTGEREVIIESRGVSGINGQQNSIRTIRQRIFMSDPNQPVNKFDVSPAFSGFPSRYYPIEITGSQPSAKSITQQFDISGLNTLNGQVTIGMSDSNTGISPTRVELNVSTVGLNARFTLSGQINALSPLLLLNPTVDAPLANSYRVKMEYVRYPGYTVVRAIILKKDNTGNTTTYRCPLRTSNYLLYGYANARGLDPNYNILYGTNREWKQGTSTVDAHIRFQNDVKIDNMTYWIID